MKEAKKACKLLELNSRFISRNGWTYANSNPNVFGEEDSLKFNDEEIEKLAEIIREALKGVFWNDKILPRPDPRRQTAAENSMSDKFCRGRDYICVSSLYLSIPTVPSTH